MNEQLARIAQSQDGLLSTADLRAQNLTDWQYRKLRSCGWLQQVAPRVFSVAGAPRSHTYRLRLGLLALGDGAVVSYEAAAALHRLDRSDYSAVEFTVFRSRRAPHFEFAVHTTQWLPAIDRVQVDGFAVTSATRTVLDLAHARRGRPRIEAAIDSSIRLGLSAPAVLERRLRTLRGSGRWGCRLIDDLIVDTGGHSMLERRFLELVRIAELPRPQTQVVHRKDGRHVARVDFLFEDQGIVVEVSGQHGHSSPVERERDAQRRNELQDLGRLVFEYTWADITQRSVAVTRSLRQRLQPQ